MAKIRNRGASFQVDARGEGLGRRAYRTEAEAKTALAHIQAGLGWPGTADGAPSKGADGITLAQAFSACWSRYWNDARSAKAIMINCLEAERFFGTHRPLAEVADEEALDEYRAHLQAKRNSPATINRKFAVLSRAFRHAHARRKLDRLPQIEREREASVVIRFLSPEEEDEALAWFRSVDRPDVADWCRFSILTGLRTGEALGAKAIHEVSGSLAVRTEKGGGSLRYVPLTDEARGLLEERRWRGLTEDRLRHAWDRARAHLGKAGEPGWGPYITRHTFASRLVQRGVPLQVVSKLLGHSTMQMTMRYAHLAPNNLRQAIEEVFG